jgi:hypothetical protein
LQTEDYAREVIGAVEYNNPQRIDALVDLRMQRQEILVRKPAPQLHFIMDEAVIRRLVGGPPIARQQLRHLREISDYPNVTMRVVPFSVGMYPRLRVPYVLFEFPEPDDEDVLYLESPLGEYIVRENSPEERDKINPVHYLGIFWQLEQIAPADEFAPLVDDALSDVERVSAARPQEDLVGQADGTQVRRPAPAG